MALANGGISVFATVILAAMVTRGLGNFAHRDSSWHSFLASTAVFLLALATIALTPFDVAGALCNPSDMSKAFTWQPIYWITMLLTWVVCPLLFEYEASGEFTVVQRLTTAIRRNAVSGGSFIAIGTLALLSVTMRYNDALGVVLMAAANAWGALLATFLMGYGFAAVPRELWRLASPSSQLRWLHCMAVAMDEARLSTQFELQEVISEARIEIVTRSVQTWDPAIERAFDVLQLTLEESEQLHCELTHGARNANRAEGGIHSSCGSVPRGGEDASRLPNLVELHRSLKQSAFEARRAACRWDELVRQCLALQDLEEQMYPSAAELAASWEGSCARGICQWHPARSFWHSVVTMWLRHLRRWVLRVASFMCALLSGAIVLAQVSVPLRSRPIFLLEPFFKDCAAGSWMAHVACLVVLGYMIGASLWSLFRFKLAGWCGLYSGHTDSCSLLWCACMLGRLAAPMCYQFTLLVDAPPTAFRTMMDEAYVVPFVSPFFDMACPAFVGALVVCHVFGIYPRLVQILRLDALEVDWTAPPSAATVNELMEEGRRLVERERRRRSEDRSLLEMARGGEGGRVTVPLRLQIAALIEDGTLPLDWNAHSPP
mmetsp:Transcript_65745/g.189564  ORF Transcript_65745/g.189564 Transcript_65745/m.189564 type:complete len:603 (+) Transcript_65745:77-1885(+)